MQNSATTLLRRNVPGRGARRVFVLLLAVVAVVVGLLTLHAPGTAAHGHGADGPAAGAHSGAASHSHAVVPLSAAASDSGHLHVASDPGHLHAASGSDHGEAVARSSAAHSFPVVASSVAPDAVLPMASGGPGSAECPEVGGTHCCTTTVACVPVLALLSASQALDGAPVVLAGVALSVVAAFTLRLAPVRPPSLAQLSTFRI